MLGNSDDVLRSSLVANGERHMVPGLVDGA
jgi:hypothetical protein